MLNKIKEIVKKIEKLANEANELAVTFPDSNTGLQKEVPFNTRTPFTEQEAHLADVRHKLADIKSMVLQLQTTLNKDC